MDVSLILWAIVIVMGLQPLFRQRMRETMRQRQISRRQPPALWCSCILHTSNASGWPSGHNRFRDCY